MGGRGGVWDIKIRQGGYMTSGDFSNLAITFDHDLQMTRNWYGSKALVEAHLFRGVLKNLIFDRSSQTDVGSGMQGIEGVKPEAWEAWRGPWRAK